MTDPTLLSTPASLRVAVLGAGAIGLGTAALLASRGHHPVLWSPTSPAPGPHLALHAEGALTHAGPVPLAPTLPAAVAGADAVLIAVPANAYAAVLERLAPALCPNQPVIFSGHLSFAALHLSRLLAARQVTLPIIAWGTTITSGRRTAPGQVRLSSIRSEVDLATLPASAGPASLALCRTLFGDRFRPRAGLLAIALSNVNPQNHLAIALCNFTRIERGETWFQNTNITDSVGRLMEALDAERLAIAAALGIPVRTLRQHFHLSFHTPEAPLGEMARALADAGSNPAAPTSTGTRYVLEDAPFGLHPTILLGRLAGCPAPLHEAGLLTLSALYGQDLAGLNDIVPALGLQQWSLAELRHLASEGYPS